MSIKYKDPQTGEWKEAGVATIFLGEGTEREMFFPPENILSYIKKEAAEIAEKVCSVQTTDSITFLTLSDTHYHASQATSGDPIQNNEGNEHTAMAIKALAYMLDIDFMAHLGDVSAGAGDTTPIRLKEQIEGALSFFNEANSNIPCFVAIGNHDSGIYYNDAKNDGNVYTISGDYLYRTFTALSASENTIFAGEENGGYCYRDFPEKKLRVFLLNTSERLVTDQYDTGTLPSQQLWTARALENLGAKEDATEWRFIVLCHYPLDYGDARPISNVFKAYVNGESITVAGETVNFSGKNSAKFVAQFHGHTHCFKYAKLNGYNTAGVMSEYDAWRIATPNVQYNRENYYTSPYYGIYFNDAETYHKTPDTAEETSFTVNVYVPEDDIVYSFCYGAGVDRAVSLKGAVYYSVNKELTYATLTDESDTIILEGSNYSSKVSVLDGGTLKSVSVIMGGTDITATAYDASTGNIFIEEVTGNIVITVVAKAPAVNLLTLAIDTDGSPYNGGKGYKSGYRLSTSDGGDRTQSGMYASGFIPISADQTLLLNNVGRDVAGSSNGYNESYLIRYYALGTAYMEGQITLKNIAAQADGSIRITAEELKLEDGKTCKYIRLSCSYLGDDTTIFVE